MYFVKAVGTRYSSLFTQPAFFVSFITSLLFLGGSLVVNFYAGTYASNLANNPVTDIVLNNIRVFDVDFIYVYGIVASCLFIFLLCILRPEQAPFVAKTIGLFVIVRSLFIILTHIGPFPVRVALDSTLINDFTFSGDLFFSGHTGLPFLMALVYWQNIRLRYLFIGLSILFGVTVLLGHLHYSIDVLGAFFITYTIYHLATKFFKKEHHFFSDSTSFFTIK